MKKTRLDPEQLVVETFPTAPEVERIAGTVHAAEAPRTREGYTCDGAATCGGTSCGGGHPHCTCLPVP